MFFKELQVLIWNMGGNDGKMRLTTIWVSPDTYRKLLQVERFFIKKNGGTINPNDAVKELIEFWKKHQS